MIAFLKNKVYNLLRTKNYKYFGFTWGDVWKRWHLEHYLEVSVKTKNLKQNLDLVSCIIIDSMIERYFFLIPWQKQDQSCLYNTKLFFNKYEEQWQRNSNIVFNGSQFSKSYVLPEGYDYSISVFYPDNGMRFLPDEVINYIDDKDIIDGGAFIGDSALVFLKYNPRKIYCFEPHAHNYQSLLRTIKLNSTNKIVPIKMGLGKSSCQISLCGNSSEASVCMYVEDQYISKEIVEITYIDKFVKENKLHPSLIKLDVEGNEFEAIEGAIETIVDFRPVLIISIYHTPKDFFDIKPFIESKINDYIFMISRLDPFHPTNETVLIGYDRNLVQVSKS